MSLLTCYKHFKLEIECFWCICSIFWQFVIYTFVLSYLPSYDCYWCYRFYEVLVSDVLHAVMWWPSWSALIINNCWSCSSLCWKRQMKNCKNAPHIEIPCQESHCSYLADFCTAFIPSSLRFARVGENGRDSTGKEGSCSEYDVWLCYVITKAGFNICLEVCHFWNRAQYSHSCFDCILKWDVCEIICHIPFLKNGKKYSWQLD